MTTFIVVAGLLLLVALAAVLWPLLKAAGKARTPDSSALSLQVLREQLGELENENRAGTLDPAQYEKERAEIERRAIEDGRPAAAATATQQRPLWLAAGISVGVGAMAIGLYLALGTPAALDGGPGQGAPQQNAHAVTPQQIQAMVAKLSERLQDNPGDAEGWLMLARSYGALGRYPEAAAAFGRATALMPPDAQLLSDYADTLAMAQGRRLQGEPERIIRLALAADPRNIKALALAGSAAFERQDYAAAIGEWRKVLDVVPADSNVAERIRTSIADAQARAGANLAQTVGKGVPAAAAASIRGVVALDAGLRGRVTDTDTVFVFARPVAGPRMPLAAMRLTVKDLPARFSLDDSMSLAGGPKLSEQKQVTVGARISKSGNAIPQSGDLEGLVEGVAVGSDSVRLTISRVVP